MRISPRISIGISVSVGVRSRACTRIGSRRPRPKYTLVDRHGKPGPGHGDTFGKLELFFRSQRGCGGMPRVRSRNAANSQRQMLHQTLRSDEVRLNQLKLLGRFFGRPPDHPARIVSFDRFLQPRIWGHPTGPEEGS